MKCDFIYYIDLHQSSKVFLNLLTVLTVINKYNNYTYRTYNTEDRNINCWELNISAEVLGRT